MSIKIKANQSVGLMFTVINLLWIIYQTYFFLAYRLKKDVLWLIMIREGILITNVIIGCIGVCLSLSLLGNKLEMKYFLIFEAILLLIEFYLI